MKIEMLPYKSKTMPLKELASGCCFRRLNDNVIFIAHDGRRHGNDELRVCSSAPCGLLYDIPFDEHVMPLNMVLVEREATDGQ